LSRRRGAIARRRLVVIRRRLVVIWGWARRELGWWLVVVWHRRGLRVALRGWGRVRVSGGRRSWLMIKGGRWAVVVLRSRALHRRLFAAAPIVTSTVTTAIGAVSSALKSALKIGRGDSDRQAHDKRSDFDDTLNAYAGKNVVIGVLANQSSVD